MATQYIEEFGQVSSIPSRIATGSGGKYGVGVVGGRFHLGTQPLAMERIVGNVYFVNPSANAAYGLIGAGDDTSNDGKSWAKPFATMSKAFSVITSGDVIYFTGKVREQLVTPVNVFDVSIVGVGNRPHHADATPTGGQYATATWTTPASGATTAALVKVLQQGWYFENILFAGPTDHACIWLFRDAGAGDAERDASHATIRNCRFASGQDGIQITEVANVLIEGNVFGSGVGGGMTGFDILGVAGAGIANPLLGQLRNNTFFGSTNHVKLACNNWLVTHNYFDDGGTPNTTVVLNVDQSSNGAGNFVVHNYFQTTTGNFNTPDIVGTATDVWTDNMAIDTAAAGTSGISETGQPA